MVDPAARQQVEVHELTAEELRDPRNCGPTPLQAYGCWRQLDVRGGCKIMVLKPRHSADTSRLQTLGLEVWKCFHKNTEY